MRNVVKYLIISFVFVGFMMFGSTNEVYASEANHSENDLPITLLTVSSVVNFEGQPFIYYIDSSDYSVLLKEAVSTWNQFGVVTIIENQEEYGLEIINEELGYNGIVAQYINTSQSSYILINDTYFIELTSEEKLHVLTHELGHALGLNDLPYDSEYESIMIQEINSSTAITYHDIYNLMEFINSSSSVLNIEPVTYYLCFASANDGLDGASCVGPGGGGGSTSVTNYTIEDRIRIYFNYLNNDNYYYVIDTYNEYGSFLENGTDWTYFATEKEAELFCLKFNNQNYENKERNH